MDERLRFLLYGTYDGFSQSSFGDDNIFLILDNGDRAEVPRHLVKNTSDFIEKNKIKLKDVITRIKGLNIGIQKVWLNEILNELGSDYGTLKYKDGYERGKLYGEWVGQQLKDADKIRLELNKPVVPQFVADWYEKNKNNLDYNIWNYVYEWEDQEEDEFKNWFNHSNKAFQIIANMHQFGYTVEQKRYLVKMKGVSVDSDCLNYDSIDDEWYLASDINGYDVRTHHTRKDLENAGFGWVFDCPGVEIEEVEDDTKI